MLSGARARNSLSNSLSDSGRLATLDRPDYVNLGGGEELDDDADSTLITILIEN